LNKLKDSKSKYPTEITFLSSISRNSLNSKYAYERGLAHFQRFLEHKYPEYNLEAILKPLSKNEMNVYELLDNFISYLLSVNSNLTPTSLKLYVASIRSYLAYYDIDVIPSKFRRKVKMPKVYREDEEPLDVNDIRKILLSCNNRRLKTYLLVLASGGLRAIEALAIRIKDIDLSVSPTKIHIRKEFTKTKVARDIYISDEATHYLKQWIDWKYNNYERPRLMDQEDLLFAVYKSTNNPRSIYVKILTEFEKLLTIVGMDERKEQTMQRRRKITLHSFRRFVKTVISDQTNQDYSEGFLGHASKSPYYTKKEPERREIYVTKCMKYLTFLDYTVLEATGKNIEAKVKELEKEKQALKERYDSDITLLKDAIYDMQQLLKNPEKLAEIAKVPNRKVV
jgi:integrase